ncbi:MAG: hypothetical protein IJ791_06295, partial [Lachnospiraceae bacterium]|nr:hypothetical protein [Lachnospiraceae bacterium]
MHPDNISVRTMILNNRGMARDNHTDSLMLGAAAYDDGQVTSALQKALMAYHDETVPLAPYNSLLNYAEAGTVKAPASYPRYWHGYLVVLKPLLLILTYSRVRYLNMLVLSLMTIALVHGIWKRIGRKETLAFILAALMTFPFVIPSCMQYSNMVYTTLAAGNIMVYAGKGIWEKKRVLYFWLILGIATAYFDFLTYPVLALGVVLVLQELVIKETTWKNIVVSIGAWLFGYAGMWSSKWVLAEVLTDEHVISDAISQVVHRTVGESDVAGRKANALTAIAANLSCYTNVVFIVLILICIIVFICNLRAKKTIVVEGKSITKRNVHLLWIASIPFVWFALTASHSFDHSSYTYRSIMVTVFALLVFACPMTPTADEERVSEYMNE